MVHERVALCTKFASRLGRPVPASPKSRRQTVPQSMLKFVDMCIVVVSATFVCRNLLCAREILKSFGGLIRVLCWTRARVSRECIVYMLYSFVPVKYMYSSTYKPLQIRRWNYTSGATPQLWLIRSQEHEPNFETLTSSGYATPDYFTSLKHRTRFPYRSGATCIKIPLLTCLRLASRRIVLETRKASNSRRSFSACQQAPLPDRFAPLTSSITSRISY